MDTESQVYIIIGATRGIGAATAELLAERGHRVVGAGRNEAEGRELFDRLSARGLLAAFEPADITNGDQLRGLIEATASRFGGIDVLVNNAATADPFEGSDGTLENTEERTFRRVLDVNLVGPWLAAKLALPHLKRSANPSIINGASVAAFQAYPGITAYGASKAGLVALTKYLAMSLSPYGIRVNAYAPDQVATGMLRDYLASAADPDAASDALLETHLIPRFGEPAEVGELIAFLASDKARYITGQTFMIDGGTQAWRGKSSDLVSRSAVSSEG